MKISTSCTTIVSDLTSPAAVYLRVRDRYSRAFLFESSDYHGAGDCRSFVCCDPIAELTISNGQCVMRYGDLEGESIPVPSATGLSSLVTEFMKSFDVSEPTMGLPKGVTPGVFGHICWDAIKYAEQIELTKKLHPGHELPEVQFTLFRYVVAFNPLRNEAYVLQNRPEGGGSSEDEVRAFVHAAFEGEVKTFPFRKVGREDSVLSDEEFMELVRTCKRHIARGDVFQIVPSRRFMQPFEGDDFQVYRALRSINPSPYLFYCDYGTFRLFGSSPEAQISVSDGAAAIYPLAGTYPRTGNDEADKERAEQLLEDPKENAEHCMLVDLARNDLSRHCRGVHVERFRETQYFSHLIHLVSKVVGRLPEGASTVQVVSDTFPAGTLSGAPKHRAMQLIDTYEPHSRGQYGGCVGFLGFNGDAVLGICIRSFLSIRNTLVYQGGGGVVHDSVPETELREVQAKLGALRAAIEKAGDLMR
jgi:anthranilate synthase component 1